MVGAVITHGFTLANGFDCGDGRPDMLVIKSVY